VPIPDRRTPRVALVLVALAVALIAAVGTAAGARDPGSSSSHTAQAAGEVATGDTRAMFAVVQRVVDCLRGKGLHPGDPRVHGDNVVIADWDPGWDSAAGRATEECSFPAP
jgi:hypothetical protein